MRLHGLPAHKLPLVDGSDSRFDLPPVVNAPDGFATLLESYGSRDQTRDTAILGSSERDPILVTW